ncbi:MAG: ABC transporter permease subunit, partial [Microlunatus sp.]|nr:ABC transporter permease subunit [Microlunatus sp.]
KVFAMQGLGALLLDAVGNLDLQVLVGVTLFSAFLIIVANFVVDISYGLLDPRIKAVAR